MVLPAYLRRIVDAGDATIGVSNIDKEGSFIGHPFEIERRGIADTKQEAVALGKPVFVDEKGARVTVKTEPLPQEPGLSVVLKGKNIDKWGVANLARNSGNQLRRANARSIEQPGMDAAEELAGRKYGYVSQALRDDTHHITGINSTARWHSNIDPRRREAHRRRANSQGLFFGDDRRNQSAIPGERAIGRPNLHQGVIHTAEHPDSVTALLSMFGMPNATHPKVDLVTPFMQQLRYNSQKESAAMAGHAIERLGVQLTMLDKKKPGSAETIRKSIEMIRKHLRGIEPMGPINERPNGSNARELIAMLDALPKG